MRSIICRFRNKSEIDALSSRVKLKLNEYIQSIELPYEKIEYMSYSIAGMYVNESWIDSWVDMPEYRLDFKDKCYHKIEFLFSDDFTNRHLSLMFNQNVSDKTTHLWYPKFTKDENNRDLRVLGGENPIYPVYVVSKSRAVKNSWHTSFRLTQMCIPHYLVVEPSEVAMYREVFNNEYCTILELDMSYKDSYDVFSDLGNINSTGPGPARNFCWEHSMGNGFKWHWVLDDNIDGWNMYFRGNRIPVRTGECFRSCERFVERYDNIAIAGHNYASFYPSGTRRPPYITNTRIYSMLLIRNYIPYRWRGRYNEDTDLSLRVLKDGWCTVQFNIFLGEKLTTQKVRGGNSKEFYDHEGTNPKSQMLVDMHPDVSRITYKFSRIHHEVDYSKFTTPLRLIDCHQNYGKPIRNNFGLEVYRIPRELCNTEYDNREWLDANKHLFERVGNTNWNIEVK